MFLQTDPNILSPFCRRDHGKVIKRVAGWYDSISVADVLDFLPELNVHGFRCYGRLGSITDSEHSKLRADLLDPNSLGGMAPAHIEQLDGWLSSFKPSRHWKQNSYDLKHTFERETGTYFMDGAFITCVLMKGFEIKIAGPTALIKMQRPAR